MEEHLARNVLQAIAKANGVGACWNHISVYVRCQERELTHALFNLEQKKIIFSEMVHRGNGAVRLYHLTAEGERRLR